MTRSPYFYSYHYPQCSMDFCCTLQIFMYLVNVQHVLSTLYHNISKLCSYYYFVYSCNIHLQICSWSSLSADWNSCSATCVLSRRDSCRFLSYWMFSSFSSSSFGIKKLERRCLWRFLCNLKYLSLYVVQFIKSIFINALKG